MIKGSTINPFTNSKQISNQNNPQENFQTDTSLKSIFSAIQDNYGGKVPWTNLNNRLAYKFYPKEISGLTLAVDEVGTIHDDNYNPLIVFALTDNISVPLKNAYVSYYYIPEVLNKKFNLNGTEVVLPLELKVYEFDRKFTESETSIITKGENFNCTNKKAKTQMAYFSNPQIVMNYCNVNLTSEQKSQVKNGSFFDEIYEIYFADRNSLVVLSADTAHIKDSQVYVSDYLAKLFNSNDNLFVTQSQIRSVEDSRRFEEWRSKTFDKK